MRTFSYAASKTETVIRAGEKGLVSTPSDRHWGLGFALRRYSLVSALGRYSNYAGSVRTKIAGIGYDKRKLTIAVVPFALNQHGE